MPRDPGPAAGALALALLAGAACRGQEGARALELTLHVAPEPPTVGTAQVEVVVTDPSGAPATGGSLRLEGNMTHPGMRPSFGECREASPGRYRGPLELTMAGDWLIQVEASFPNGRRASQAFRIPGVRP